MAFFFVVIFLIFKPILNNNQTLDNAKLRTLNRLMPPLKDLVLSSLSGEPLKNELIDEYLFYYKKVSDFMPKYADGYYMQGYCLAQKGLLTEAVKAYEKSIELNPQFFWSYYNLGLLNLKLNHIDAAFESFQKALNTKPDVTFKIMLVSKAFQQLMAQVDQPQKVLSERLKTSYKTCYQLMILTDQLKKVGNQKIPDQIYDQLEAKIF